MKRQTHSFDDVLLVPQYSDIESRSEIDLSRQLGTNTYQIPIISSPMDTVTGLEMAAVFGEMGGLAVTHRYCDMVEQSKITPFSSAAAVGVTGDYMKRIEFINGDAGVTTFCLDVAHGHHIMMKEALYRSEPVDEKEYEEAYDRVHSQYEETVKIKNVYNRFVLFPGTTHHGVQTYGTRDRLTLNFFGMGQYGSLNPLMRMR